MIPVSIVILLALVLSILAHWSAHQRLARLEQQDTDAADDAARAVRVAIEPIKHGLVARMDRAQEDVAALRDRLDRIERRLTV